MNKYEQGLKRISEVLGQDGGELFGKLQAISEDYARYAAEFAYGELYSREGLSDKIREVAAVACLIGQGSNTHPLRAHIKGMVTVGWSQKEILELIIFLINFVGFPSTLDALMGGKRSVR
ncbi:MAG TPA: carboxymuconolactone decarboxylase family protein [Terrimicrobiaceae bacterium]